LREILVKIKPLYVTKTTGDFTHSTAGCWPQTTITHIKPRENFKGKDRLRSRSYIHHE
jgi:hypothetical protein